MNGLLNHLWQSTWFAVAAALLAWGLRRYGARVRFEVWLAASLKFLVPFSALAMLGSRLPVPREAAAVLPAAGAARFETFVMPITAGALPPASGIPWAWILGSIWIVGSVAAAVRWLRRWRRMASIAAQGERREPVGALEIRIIGDGVEPGVFGVWRPVLLVPKGIEERLTPAQFAAVLVHERCHVRRRDNLWSALHMVVETVFWFHPFVWWIGARMVAERERACDEAVLSAGGDAVAYAAGILSVCKHYEASPLACTAGVSGGPLQRRLQEILDGHWGRTLGRRGRWLLAVLGAAVLLGPVAAGMMYAQSGPAAFEVASIRPGEQPGPTHKIGFGMHLDPQRLTVENMPLKDLIVNAYGLRPYQVVGPDWMAAEPFSISATTVAPATHDQMMALLQPFLVKQFGIRMHRGSKTMPVYAMKVAPGGFKLTPSATALPPGAALGQFMLMLSPSGLRMRGMATIDQIAAVLSQQLSRPVVNQTSLRGVYKFDLTFAPLNGLVTMGGLQHVPQMNGAPMKFAAPSVFTALQEQMGLTLSQTKAPVELLVIDSANRTPRGN